MYADPTLAKAVAANDMITLQADLTRPVPRLEKLLVAHGGAALPYAVVLDARGQVMASFSGLFTTDALVQAIEQTHGEQPS